MSKRRGVVADPQIVRLAEYVAGVVGAVLQLDRTELLERARPTDQLKAGRYVMIAIMHHHFCFNQKTGAVARASPATQGKHWSEISQQRIAAALKRDRGVISDAWHAMEDAINLDFDVAFALDAIADALVPVIECGDAWAKALEQRALDAAMGRAREQFDEPGRTDEAPAKPSIEIRCHACRGEGKVRIHRVSTDPRYVEAWRIAERAEPTKDGFHWLFCVGCNGAGVQKIQTRNAAAP